MIDYKALHDAYAAEWPSHCKTCGGSGVTEGVYDSETGFTDQDCCPACSSVGICPRCGAVDTLTDDCDFCRACGWTMGESPSDPTFDPSSGFEPPEIPEY